MELRARPTMLQHWRPILDRRLAQGGIVIGAFATAAVLAALYGPGPREAASLRQSILQTTTAAAADTIHDEPAASVDEQAARRTAERIIADALNRQAAAQETAAQAPVADPQNAAAAPAPAAVAPSPADEDFGKLASKAADAIHQGDIAGARLVLERAVVGGDTTAIYALAETYDPRILAQLRVRGMKGDPDKARALYQQALAKGVTQAQARLAPADK